MDFKVLCVMLHKRGQMKVVVKEAFKRSPRGKSEQSWGSTRSATLLLIYTRGMFATET